MLSFLQRWNARTKKWLWGLVILGILASLPIAYQRIQTESSANTVEFVFDYRDLLDVAAYQPNPQQYVDEQLDRLKEAGVQSMAMFESTLAEYKTNRRVLVYNAAEMATLTGQAFNPNENYTYILFTNEENERRIAPLVTNTFSSLEIGVKPWTWNDKNGLIIETPVENAVLKPMPQDPIAMEMLHGKGFHIVPRLTDSLPYDQQAMEQLFAEYAALGVKRILFEGESVKGYTDDAEKKSIAAFAELLNKYDIGIAAIENLKSPQKGMNKLAYLINYNVVRIYSLSEADSSLSESVIADRFVLGTKDRNIRMIYLNTQAATNPAKASITNSVDNLIRSLQKPGNAIAGIESNGFELGQAQAFNVHDASWQRYAKLFVLIGGVALIALLISYFIPVLMLPAFVIGLIGAAGLYKLSPPLLEQAMALGVSISSPTIALVLLVRKVMSVADAKPDMTAGRRVGLTIALYAKTAAISLASVPLIIALLNNITYSLVLEQFRGVSLLHLAPIGLVALYVFLYRGDSVVGEARKLLKTPITLLWIVAFCVLGAAGYYYLTRTGNAGKVSGIEMVIRTLLEDTFGVRPRFKEFMMAHPAFVLGLFLSFKYRNAVYLFIIAAMGQLSLVDTFAHIHTPIVISLIRVVLGLGLGLIIGLIAAGVWQILERCWQTWGRKLVQAKE